MSDRWGLALLGALVAQASFGHDLALDPAWFDPDGLRAVYDYAIAYADRYQAPPTWTALRDAFPTLPPTPPVAAEPLEYYRDQLWRQWARAHLQEQLAQQPWDDPEQAARTLRALSETLQPPGRLLAEDVAKTTAQWVQEYLDHPDRRLLSTGSREWDRWMGGWLPQEYAVVVARPHVGKTWILMQLAIHCWAANDAPVLFLNLENSPQEFALRWHALMGRFAYPSLVAGLNSFDDVPGIAYQLRQYAESLNLDGLPPFHVVHGRDLPHPLQPQEIPALIEQYRPCAVFVDQFSKLDPDQRVPTIRERYINVSRGLFWTAQRHQCPVIVAAQLGRERQIQESDNLYQDATCVMEWSVEGYGDATMRRGRLTKSHVVDVQAMSQDLAAHLAVNQAGRGIWWELVPRASEDSFA